MHRTDLNLLCKENMLLEIDRIITAAEDASGSEYDVAFAEYPRETDREINGLFTRE